MLLDRVGVSKGGTPPQVDSYVSFVRDSARCSHQCRQSARNEQPTFVINRVPPRFVLSSLLRRYEVRLDIPSQTMAEKLKSLLKDVPGTFKRHGHPTVRQRTHATPALQTCKHRLPRFHDQARRGKPMGARRPSRVRQKQETCEKGLDIVAPNSWEWAKRQFLWTKACPHGPEYRIHILMCRVIHQSLRRSIGTPSHRRTDGLPIRNTSTGYSYNHRFDPPAGFQNSRRCARRELG